MGAVTAPFDIDASVRTDIARAESWLADHWGTLPYPENVWGLRSSGQTTARLIAECCGNELLGAAWAMTSDGGVARVLVTPLRHGVGQVIVTRSFGCVVLQAVCPTGATDAGTVAAVREAVKPRKAAAR